MIWTIGLVDLTGDFFPRVARTGGAAARVSATSKYLKRPRRSIFVTRWLALASYSSQVLREETRDDVVSLWGEPGTIVLRCKIADTFDAVYWVEVSRQRRNATRMAQLRGRSGRLLLGGDVNTQFKQYLGRIVSRICT